MWFGTFRKLVRIEESLFGLPLALIGALLPFSNEEFARQFDWSDWGRWVWIFLAFFSARSAGMAFNRLIDRHIDALNPRTRDRPLQKKEISVIQVEIVAWGGLALFLYCCWNLNTMCFLFSPLIAFLIMAYSFTKRFTAMCHFVLGLIEFFAPFLGWIAITGTWGWPPFFLGLGVLLWISGIDILYALQDLSFDRKYRLHSVPVSFGIKRSMLIARCLHLCSVALLLLAGYFADVSFVYYFGLVLVSALFVYQHTLIQPRNLRKMRRAFFTCNSLIAVTQCVFTIGAIVT